MLSCISGLASTILNGLVVYVCIRKMKSLVSCDFYILNLAIIDILMPVFGFPLTIYSSMNHKWVVGEFRKYFFGKCVFSIIQDSNIKLGTCIQL